MPINLSGVVAGVYRQTDGQAVVMTDQGYRSAAELGINPALISVETRYTGSGKLQVKTMNGWMLASDANVAVSVSTGNNLTVTSNGTGAVPKVGDVLSIVVPYGAEASDYSFRIDRGAGYVQLSTGSLNYTLQPADIAPVGSTWNIMARAVASNLVSAPFSLPNPSTQPAAPVATAVTLTGPNTATAGTASGAYTVALSPNGGTVASPVTVTPTPVAGVTFLPASLTLSTASPSGTFTANASTAGTKVIAVTSTGGLAAPATINLVVTAAALTEAFTEFTLDGLRSSASPARATMAHSKCFTNRAINPASNTVIFDAVFLNQPNSNRNPPSSGWTTLLPSEELYADNVGTPNAQMQLWTRVSASNNRAVAATISTGLVASVNLVAHGLVTGDVRAHDGYTPSGYNSIGTPVNVIDADNYTYPLAAAAGAVTVLGYMYNSSESLIIEQGVTP